MKRLFVLITGLLIVQGISMGQVISPHLNIFLKKSSKYLRTEPNRTMGLFVKATNMDSLYEVITALGGKVLYHYGKWAVVHLPVNNIRTLAKHRFIKWIDYQWERPVPLSDMKLVNNNIVPLFRGDPPFYFPIKGKGVILGFADTGIDINHPDFWDSVGKSRILFVWDQRANCGNPPAPFGYGCEWTRQDIESGMATHQDPVSFLGHGTSVAGNAAGNGSANPQYPGVAPEAYIIMVAVDFSSPFFTHLADAIQYMFQKADSLGMPIAVNVSLGVYGGSHDGFDPTSQLIASMLNEKPGRVIVSAAGNGRRFSPWHARFDNLRNQAWFVYDSVREIQVRPDSSMWLEFYGPVYNSHLVRFSLALDSVYGGLWRGTMASTPTHDFLTCAIKTADPNDSLVDILTVGGQTHLIVQWYCGYLYDSATAVIVAVPKWTGTGWQYKHVHWLRTTINTDTAWDTWSHIRLTGTTTLVDSANYPDLNGVPFADSLTAPNWEMTIVSGLQCRPEVITVANYVNRTEWYDIDSNLQTLSGFSVGELYSTSSWGPTRTGLMKPDISSTGQFTITTVASNAVSTIAGSPLRWRLVSNYYWAIGGTSLASPVVAGVAGLYLSVKPDATYQEIKDAIIQNARTDSFTGPTPNIMWGYGKLDAYSALANTLTGGCTDTTADNYDPNADYDDGSCTYTFVEATGFSDQCVFGGVRNGKFTIVNYCPDVVEISLYDVIGRTMRFYMYSKESKVIDVPAGLYFVTINNENTFKAFIPGTSR